MIRTIIEIACDTPGCDTAYQPQTDLEMTVRSAARTGAILAGWYSTTTADHCPNHRPADDTAERVRELAGRRLTDGQIGIRLGLTRWQVQAIRRRHDIAPGLGRVGRPSVLDGGR